MREHKKNRVIVLLIVSVAILAGAIYWWTQGEAGDAQDITYVEKVLRFSFTLTNTSSDFIPSAEFSSYLPLSLPGRQEIVEISTNHRYSVRHDDQLHQSIVFSIDNLAPYASKVVNLTIVVKVSTTPSFAHEAKNKTYLKSEKYIELDAEPVQTLVGNLRAEQASAKATYHWLSENISNVGYVAENRGALFAIENRIGDCTEHMHAFLALTRGQGIPSRGMAGFFVVNTAEIINSSSYHNWAEFLEEKRWLIADSQKRIFHEQYENYIAFRVIGGEFESANATGRFLTTDHRISVQL